MQDVSFGYWMFTDMVQTLMNHLTEQYIQSADHRNAYFTPTLYNVVFDAF